MLKTKKLLWIAAAIVGCGLSTLATSCSDNQVSDSGTKTDSTQVDSIQRFYTAEINKLIDANYAEVQKYGYAKLVIPASMYDTAMIQMPQYHKDVMAAMNKLGYKTYVNGGAVRDGVLGTSIHDVDFSTDATPEEMKEKLTGYDVVITKTSGGNIAQAKHSNGDKTDMVPIRGINIKLKGQTGVPADGAFGEAYSKSLLDDTYNRELSFNSLYYDYATGDIIDFHGGLRDLREHIVRTNYDGNLMYPLYPDKLIRTVRFAARYNFKIDKATGEAVKNNLNYVDSIAASSALFNFMKGFTDGCGRRTYQYYLDYGLTEHFFTMLKDYLRSEKYTDRLFPMLDYFDEQKVSMQNIFLAAFFLPCMENALGSKEWTLLDITETWDRLVADSNQNENLLDDKYGMKTEVMTIFKLYKQMTSDATLADDKLVETIKGDKMYKFAKTFLAGCAQSDESLKKYLEYWK